MKTQTSCRYCEKIHDSRLACPEYAAQSTPTPSLPPAVGQAHTPTGFRFFELNDRMLRLVRNSEEDPRLETHLCEIPIIYKDDAAFIVHACNTSAAHEAKIAALVGALHEIANRAGNTEDDLSGAWAAQHALAALTSVQQP